MDTAIAFLLLLTAVVTLPLFFGADSRDGRDWQPRCDSPFPSGAPHH